MTVDCHVAVPPLTQIPSAAQLTLEFNPMQLLDDLGRLTKQKWHKRRSYRDNGNATAQAEVDWRALPLRSLGGDAERTDPGGPGLHEFHDTHWLTKTPYLAEVLQRIPAQKRAVRLLALGPGAASSEHNDTKYGLRWGIARLHVPITTNPGAKLFIEETLYQWQPGSLWFGDFSRKHRVENTHNLPRVHMVVDTLVSAELMKLFPSDYLTLLNDNVLINRRRTVLSHAELGEYRVRFPLPTSFANWEEENGEFLRPQKQLDAIVDIQGTRLVLVAHCKELFTLIHIGDGEFRFSGWSDERTIQIMRTCDAATVTLRSRCGGAIHELKIPAQQFSLTREWRTI